MKLSSISIVGYKGFEKCDIEFNNKLNVFIGSNASGKTTLLDAIGTVFNNFTQTLSGSGSLNNLRLSDHSINQNSEFTTLNAELSDLPDSKFTKINWFLGFGPRKLWSDNNFNQISKQMQDFRHGLHQDLQSTTMSLPILKYYPADRDSAKLQINQGTTNTFMPQLVAWKNFYQDEVSFTNFLNWFFNSENNELRTQKANNDFSVENPRLRDVRIALSKTLQYLENENSE